MPFFQSVSGICFHSVRASVYLIISVIPYLRASQAFISACIFTDNPASGLDIKNGFSVFNPEISPFFLWYTGLLTDFPFLIFIWNKTILSMKPVLQLSQHVNCLFVIRIQSGTNTIQGIIHIYYFPVSDNPGHYSQNLIFIYCFKNILIIPWYKITVIFYLYNPMKCQQSCLIASE